MPGPIRERPGDPLADDLPGRRPAGAGPGPAGPGPGDLLRRPRRGRDALGQVQQHRRGGRPVDDVGRLKVTGRGEAYVSVWFASRVGRVTVTVALSTPSSIPASSPRPRGTTRSTRRTSPSWPRSRIPPSPDAGDAAFLRRAYLDATGTLPPTRAGRSLPQGRDPAQTRASWSNRLLESSEFVDYWAYKWSDLLLVSSRKLAVPVDVVVLSVRARRAWRRTSPGTGSPARS